jgi:hypothetical protein
MPQRQTGIIIDGTLVGIARGNSEIPKTYVIQPEKAATKNEDYSAASVDAVKKRKDRLAGFQLIPGRIRGGKKYVLKRLKNETEQIRDLILAVRAGKLHHTFGLASRIRLLIAQGNKPMPLLHTYAAMQDKALTVYVRAKPFSVPIIEELGRSTGYGFSCDVAAKPAGQLINPLDLDVWLNMRGGNIMQKEFSNRELLKAIGNTVASHVDQDLHPYVDMLESIQTAMPIDCADQLVAYIVKVADLTLVLADRLISGR